MSKLWSTLKSVVGTGAPAAAARDAEFVAAAATSAVNTLSSSPASSAASLSDGLLQGFAAIKPHNPMIKFR